ncbi:hypothetical protein HGM15179_016903 [Zosterops borbonicus]|uniref:Uncharacterized protein n=1 Tax=Zosterops borbonicus TaxID=364589 RepID=A0A8K1LDT7_9PASS|nr:hypothetical protein HGM15179_016903 [Zosterops borbonicus]
MEEDKTQPKPQPPRPWPGPQRAQAWSEQQEEAQRGSPGPRRGRRGAWDGDVLFVPLDTEEGPELSRGEINKHQRGTAGEACAEPQLSPGDAHGPQELSGWDEGLGQDLCQGESESCWDSDWEELRELQPSRAEVRLSPAVSKWGECKEQELSQGDIENYQGHSDWEDSPEQCLSPGEGTSRWTLLERDAYRKQKLSQTEATSQHQVSYWKESMKPGLFRGELASSPGVSDWEEQSQQGLSLRESRSYQEHSDWEECIGQEVSKGKAKRRGLSVQPSWEDDSDRELVCDSWVQPGILSLWLQILLWQEDNDWDKVSVLELCKEGEEARLQRLAALT